MGHHRLLCVLALVVCLGGVASADSFPPALTLPAGVKSTSLTIEGFGQSRFMLPDDKEVVLQGKHWFGPVDTTALGSDDRKTYTTLVAAFAKGGWELVLGMQQTNPPYASMKLVKGGKETWMDMWVGTETQISVLEKGAPTVKLVLAAPVKGIGKLGDKLDFPALQHFSTSKLTSSARDERPMLVTLEAGKDPVLVATGSMIKHYDLPAHTGPIEPVFVYRDALTAAGWTIVEVNTAVTLGDPNLTAHYAVNGVDLWAHVHSGGELVVQMADAGAEREIGKLKAELDRTCKVAIYGVNFDFDKATLRPDATSALESILKLLTQFKDLKIELGGHTDNVGGPGYNQKLSESRVAAVKSWLTDKGIAADRLTTHGYADTQPVMTNDTVEGMARNRRVELRKLDCKK